MEENRLEAFSDGVLAIIITMQNRIITGQGCDSKLAGSIGRDFKGRSSMVFYAVAIPAAFFRPWLASAIYVGVALMWLIPDRRIERVVDESGH